MKNQSKINFLKILSVNAALLAIFGCGNGNSGSADSDDGGNGVLDIALCAPDRGPFSPEIDNEFFPLPVGRTLELEGQEAGVTEHLKFVVTDKTEVVNGITTRVVTETHSEDGEIVEVSRNFFAQAPDGTVCYYGEEVDIYENGVVANHDGSWRAEGPNQGGILMPGSPELDQEFANESAPGIAEDEAVIVGLGESRTVPAGTFTNVLHTIDWNPLEGQTRADGEDKFYAPGLGLIQDSVAVLISSAP